ncbi:histidinol-phosphatase [Bacillus sp. AGMB 02131]|uniref:Histidinol-phosphatase n=1 Tax=Peribacillus faecalis TaxID=2772559 RepID=A0A927HCR9_9BACI|nr:histidinol-phosphatase [Peribacillus faecalis]MBD3109927.1 histidinol-phosphatase [Peribacillus faecalis]
MKFDLHTHHERCGHAVGQIRDYIEAGISGGLKVIGIADHTPYFASDEDHPYPKVTMPRSDFSNYVNEVLKLKSEYSGKIDVLLGVEADYFPESAHIYRFYLDQYPFDYVIGSIHHVGGQSIFKRGRWEGLTEKERVATKEAYYSLIQQSARSNMFQILGHIDAMKAYYPDFSLIETLAVEETLKVISECDVAIEINTSGKTKDVGGWYPSADILEMAKHFDVKLTFGSDAHNPERVGDEFEEVREQLKQIGFKEWFYYKVKRRVSVPL